MCPPRWVSHLTAGHLVKGHLPPPGLFCTAHRHRGGLFLLMHPSSQPWSLFSPGSGGSNKHIGMLFCRPVHVPGLASIQGSTALPLG